MTTSAGRAAGQPTTAEELYGTWELVELAVLIDGTVSSHPLGKEPVGRIIYHPDGHMSALLMAPGRPWPPGSVFLRSSVEEQGRAAREFSAYGGRYTLTGETVVHHVEISLYPEEVGTDMMRTITWIGDQISLETPRIQTGSGRTRWNRLQWRRAE